MSAHTDPEDALTYDPPPVVVKEPVEDPDPTADEAEETDEKDDPKKPRLNKGAKKK